MKTKWFRGGLVAVVPVALPFVAGCVGNRFYHNDHTPKPTDVVIAPDLDAAAERIRSDYKDALFSYLTEPFVIEFDDQGEYWDTPSWVGKGSAGSAGRRSQFEIARDAIRLAKKAGYDITLVEFAHGWKHNADPAEDTRTPTNLQSFRSFMKALNEVPEPTAAAARPAATVRPRICIGVYLAWRGTPWSALRDQNPANLASILNQVPLNLTVWNRLNAADRVARISATHALIGLAAEAKVRDADVPGRDYVVMVGHSMGARIIERTVGQVIVGGLMLRAPEIARDLALAGKNRVAAGELERAYENEYPHLAREHTAAKTVHDDCAKEIGLGDAKLKDSLAAEARVKTENDSLGHTLLTIIKDGWALLTKPAPSDSPAAFAALMAEFSAAEADLKARITALPVPAAITADQTELQRHLHDVQRKRRQLAPNATRTESEALAVAEGRLQAQLAAVPDPMTVAAQRTALETRLEELRRQRDRLGPVETALREAERKLAASGEENRKLRADLQVRKNDLVKFQADLAVKVQALAACGKKKSDAAALRTAADTLEARATSRPADLILLLNPAADSLYSRQFVEAVNDAELLRAIPRSESAASPPWIVSISSSADWATGQVYGWSSYLGWPFRSYRSDGDRDQRRFFGTPAPHNPHFRNFTLDPVFEPATGGVPRDKKRLLADACAVLAAPGAAAAAELLQLNLDGEELNSWLGQRGQEPIPNAILTPRGIYRLKPTDDSLEGTRLRAPYWSILTDGSLIEGHNDIFTPRALALAAGLLRLSGAVESSGASGAVKRDDASMTRSTQADTLAPAQRNKSGEGAVDSSAAVFLA